MAAASTLVFTIPAMDLADTAKLDAFKKGLMDAGVKEVKTLEASVMVEALERQGRHKEAAELMGNKWEPTVTNKVKGFFKTSPSWGEIFITVLVIGAVAFVVYWVAKATGLLEKLGFGDKTEAEMGAGQALNNVRPIRAPAAR